MVGVGGNKDNNKGKVCWSFRVMAVADFSKYCFSIIKCATAFGGFFTETSQFVVTPSSMPGCPSRFIQGCYLLLCLNHRL